MTASFTHWPRKNADQPATRQTATLGQKRLARAAGEVPHPQLLSLSMKRTARRRRPDVYSRASSLDGGCWNAARWKPTRTSRRNEYPLTHHRDGHTCTVPLHCPLHLEVHSH